MQPQRELVASSVSLCQNIVAVGHVSVGLRGSAVESIGIWEHVFEDRAAS